MTARYKLTYGYLDPLRALAHRDTAQKLTAALARAYHAKHVFLLGSCRSAIQLVLRAYGRSGEVVVPGYTCHVVSEAVIAAGCTPVFADTGEHSTNMSAEALERAIPPRTTAVVITHQFGLSCDVRRMLHGLLALGDVAPAFGATLDGEWVGSFGDVGVISFNMTKVMPAGMGGALVSNNDDLVARVGRILDGPSGLRNADSWRAFGRALAWIVATSPLVYPALPLALAQRLGKGICQSLTSPNAPAPLERRLCPSYVAALFLLQLERLGWNLERRRRLADLYARELSGLPGIQLPQVPVGALPAWTQYSIFVPDKEDFYRCMLRKSIDLSWTFRYCTADSYRAPNCPNSRRAAQMVVGLPTYPGLSDKAAHRVCSVVRQYVGTRLSRAAVNAGLLTERGDSCP